MHPVSMHMHDKQHPFSWHVFIFCSCHSLPDSKAPTTNSSLTDAWYMQPDTEDPSCGKRCRGIRTLCLGWWRVWSTTVAGGRSKRQQAVTLGLHIITTSHRIPVWYIYLLIYHQTSTYVGKYTMDGWYGYVGGVYQDNEILPTPRFLFPLFFVTVL